MASDRSRLSISPGNRPQTVMRNGQRTSDGRKQHPTRQHSSYHLWRRAWPVLRSSRAVPGGWRFAGYKLRVYGSLQHGSSCLAVGRFCGSRIFQLGNVYIINVLESTVY